MTDEQTAGTPPTDDGDAAEKSPTTGTPNGDGRDADSGETDYKALHLANKGTIEKLNAELEALRARADQPPADQDDDEDATDSGNDDSLRLTRADLMRLNDLSERGDVAAKAALVDFYERHKDREERKELAKSVRHSFQLRDIEDKTERHDVLTHFEKHPRRFGDIKAARADLLLPKREAEIARLNKELEAARKQPPTDVVRTHSREVSATEAKARKVPVADFDREQAQLRAQGRHVEARARQRELNSGDIDLIE